MNSNHMSVFDTFLNLIGVVGIWPALYRLHRDEKHNPTEEVLKWMMSLLCAFWFVRSIFDFYDLSSLGGAMYAIAIIFAFCVGLFIEILLRRHFPLWFKIYLSLGLLIFFLIALAGKLEGNRDLLIGFGGYIISLQLTLLFITIFRRRGDYAKNENASIDTSIIFLSLLAPLFLSDISSYKIPYLPPLGISGGMIFAYFSIYNQALFFGRGFLLRKLFKSILASLALMMSVRFLIDSIDATVLGRFFVLFLELHLLFRIYFAVYYLNGEDEMYLFVNHVNEASKKSIPAFLLHMREHYKQFEGILLKPAEISEATAIDIKNFFESIKMVVISRYEVSNWLENQDRRWSSTELDALEKIRDLMLTHEKSHFCKLGKKRPHFVLFNCPFISYQKIIDAQTELLSQVALLIEHETIK